MSEDKLSNKVTRRDFLKAAGVSAGTLAIGGAALSACAPAAKSASKMPSKWDAETDVIVVGAGGGGLAASIEAVNAGSKSMVLEVMPTALMSNTALCGGVVMGAGTSVQKEKGIDDSIDAFKKYLTAVGGGFDDPEHTVIWAENAGLTVEWLMSLGVKFPAANLYISGNEADYANITPPVARGHTTDAHSGKPISEVLYKTATDKGVQFSFETQATKLVVNDAGEVVGVEALKNKSPYFVKANKGVVLASAGFSRNTDFIKNFMPKLMTGGSFGSTWQRGDGIVMGQAVGAKLTDMWIPQAATIGVPTTPEMTPCMVITIWGNPCVMVSKDAKRHFREDLYYEYLYDQIAAQDGGYVWAIWDQSVTDLGGELVAVPAFSKDLSTEIGKGWVKKADTIEALAAQLEVDPTVLKATIDKHNADAQAGTDTEFGKKVGLKPVITAPFYAAKTVPATCDTAGGLTTNTNAQVLNVFGEVIQRLYAAGSTTGGWRGKLYPGSGTAVSNTVTFGRIAGKHAASLTKVA
jgi:flavocytochrome c